MRTPDPDLNFGPPQQVIGYSETPQQLAATELESALFVREFMHTNGIDTLRVDDENRTPSHQLDYEDEEELDDAVAWMPRSVISNPTRPAWNPVVTADDLDAWLATHE